jgi:hypothetical protein
METICRNDNIICKNNLLHITTSINKIRSLESLCENLNIGNKNITKFYSINCTCISTTIIKPKAETAIGAIVLEMQYC